MRGSGRILAMESVRSPRERWVARPTYKLLVLVQGNLMGRDCVWFNGIPFRNCQFWARQRVAVIGSPHGTGKIFYSQTLGIVRIMAFFQTFRNRTDEGPAHKLKMDNPLPINNLASGRLL